jgi:hypothetical protein
MSFQEAAMNRRTAWLAAFNLSAGAALRLDWSRSIRR